jgi:hypothetical protein
LFYTLIKIHKEGSAIPIISTSRKYRQYSAASSAIALERFSTFGDLLKYLRRRAGLVPALSWQQPSAAWPVTEAECQKFLHVESCP